MKFNLAPSDSGFVPSRLGGMATVEYDLNDHASIQGDLRVLLKKKGSACFFCWIRGYYIFAGVKFRLL